MKYDIIEGKTTLDLIEKINVLISKGWRCQGGVALGPEYGKYITGNYYLQAMVKE